MQTQTFENEPHPRSFWLAVMLPPLGFWITLSWMSQSALAGEFALKPFLTLLFLAHAMPLAALGWTLLSICAVSLTREGLVIHRVVSDRQWPLAAVEDVVPINERSVRLRLGHRWLTLRINNSSDFVAALWSAQRKLE